ncbi:MAG: DDE-type integrase/transposase/recombinase [Dehalococcoidales bacterium]|nr:DDE-type integrase/transposase/recombinase [Dehalococcoidales bacterium]
MSFIRAKEIPPRSGNWYDYEVKTIHEGGKVIQKHIRYIGISGRSSGRASGSSPRASRPVISIDNQSQTSHIVTCKHCHSQNIRKYGTYKGEQRYWCNECKRKFADDNTLYKMKTPAKQVASALGMYFGGMPLDSIQRQLEQDYGIRMSESGIWYWVARFSRDAMEKAREFKPKVGDVWIADETVLKIGNRNVWFWDIIDVKTRYLLASHISRFRNTKACKVLINKALKVAGKKPKRIITDKLKAYIKGIRKTAGRNTQHIQGSPFEVDDTSTSIIERFHGTLKDRTKIVRGFRNIDNARLITDAWLVYYNFLKEHTTLRNIPPARAMGETPFKDWADIVETARTAPEIQADDYVVSRQTKVESKRLTKADRSLVRHIQSQALYPPKGG